GSLYLFPAHRNLDRPISGFSDGKEDLDKTSKVTGWRLHDIRRTVSTGMAGLGIRPEVIEAVLNHVSGTRGGVAGVYNRYAYLDEKREALEAWASHLKAIVTSSDAGTHKGG